MKESIKKLNETNGFILAEVKKEEKQVETKVEKDSIGWSASFENWIRNTFGEEREEAKSVASNFAVIGIRLTKQPTEGETRVFVLNYKNNLLLHLKFLH